MKNIHLLSTPKPSRLHFNQDTNKFTLNHKLPEGTNSWKPKNIYITSNEEIKMQDWCITAKGNLLQMIEGDTALGFALLGCKKIILTTDADLIKDGVQAIDDEFLEWFVKNPSCEEIELETVNNKWHNEDESVLSVNVYGLIIPKEEPKYPIGGYAPGNYMCNCSTCKTQFQGDKRAVQCEPCAIKMTKEEPKKETLEEAYDRIFDNRLDRVLKAGFTAGAKWQQERMYSEEEVLKLLLNSEEYTSRFNGRTDLKHWFEQFKKK